MNAGVRVTALLATLAVGMTGVGVSAATPDSESVSSSRTSAYKVTATTCGDSGICDSTEIGDGGQAMINVAATPARGDMRGKYTFRVMQRTKGGTWKLATRESADVNPWAASRTLFYSPTRTTEYRFILEPACYTPGTTSASCKLSTSNTVTIVVREVTSEFRVVHLDTYIQVERGDTAYVGALFEQKTSQGTWTPQIAPTTISLERLTAGKWQRVESVETDYGGLVFSVEPSSTRQYRIVVGKLVTPNVTVAVTPTSAAKLRVEWPDFISAFGDIEVDAGLSDKSGDPWVGGTEMLLQYRSSRVNSWTTIGRATWKSDEELSLSGRVQGAGYYRVYVPDYSLQREAFYA